MQRNFVETLIIPSTWREGGFNVHGETPIGLSWNAGLTTGFDLSKWNFAPEFPQYATALDLEDSDSAPLQSTHQELGLANAQHLSEYLALGYYGIPGLTLGAAISTGDAAKVAAPPNAPIPGNERVTLWEAHARWTPGKLDLTALYAHGSISNLAIANASNPGSPQSLAVRILRLLRAGRVWRLGAWRISVGTFRSVGSTTTWVRAIRAPTVRWSRRAYCRCPPRRGDYGYWPRNYDRVTTVGANFYTTPHVVFKVDYQWFEDNRTFDRLDFGMAWRSRGRA